MKIITRDIDGDSPHLANVIKLSKSNSATLGFLPRGAFVKYSTQKQLIGAFDDKNILIGYLLYDSNLKNMSAYIIHLCVGKRMRTKGIARQLFYELRERTVNDFRGIRVRCRRDFEAANIWQKLGFTAVGEMPGRSKKGSTLTVWWFDHGHPDLFNQIIEQESPVRSKIAIDANIFFELRKPETVANREAKALLNEWLQEKIELCVTKELLNEINRHHILENRNKDRTFASTFPLLTCDHQAFQETVDSLKGFFKIVSESDESDCRQLAWAIGAGVHFFVTHDKKLIGKAEALFKHFGIRVIRPSYLIINQDALVREAEYQPIRLTGTLLTHNRVHSDSIIRLEDKFRAPHETKSEFKNKLHPYLADPHKFETRTIEKDKDPLAIIIYDRKTPKELFIPLFRVKQNSLSPTLAKHLVYNAIHDATNENRVITVISDPMISPHVKDALYPNGFVTDGKKWIKANLHITDTAQNLSSTLRAYCNDSFSASSYFKNLSKLIISASKNMNIQILRQIERALWPAKIIDLPIPTFVVSIQPQWALHLFDSQIANQDLFGSDPSLMLNAENVYYRSSRPNILVAPARILWYVSKGSSKYQNTMSIRACSYLDEVMIDKPKSFYSKFQRLGVYRWKHINEVAKGNTDNNIMAFRFSNIELFHNPIHWEDLQKIWDKEKKGKFNPQAPLRISNKLFFKVYNKGYNKIKG